MDPSDLYTLVPAQTHIPSVPPPKAFIPLPRRAFPFIMPPTNVPHPGILIAILEIPSYIESMDYVIFPLAPLYSDFCGIKEPTISVTFPTVLHTLPFIEDLELLRVLFNSGTIFYKDKFEFAIMLLKSVLI